MRKTDKKIENKLRNALIEVCDFSLENIKGYQWITHKVNFNAFPDSLYIECAFVSQQAIEDLSKSKQGKLLNQIIIQKLTNAGIILKKAEKQINYIVS